MELEFSLNLYDKIFVKINFSIAEIKFQIMIRSNIGNKGNSVINQDISWNYDLYHHEEGTMFGNLYSLPLSNNFKCARNKISTKIK